MRKRILYSLLCIFVLAGLTACGSEEGVKVNSASALAKKLASDSAAKINVSKDLVLEEPIVVRGEKELVGSGKIIASVEDGEELYMLTVTDGGKLTVGGSVKIDAAGLIGGIHVQSGGQAAVKDKAVVKNASEEAANTLVEGSLKVAGGTLKDAKGHNIYNKKETVISGGEVTGSGEKYAGIYNEGTLTQTGGEISNAYNNISNVKGSTFTFEGGTNKTSMRDGVFVAKGASMKATKKEAVIENAGGRGILLQGQADIKVITVKDCGDTLIKVGKSGVLNLGNGILQEGNYHGVDNAGTMNMMGGTIQANANCGIVNTGTLKVTSGNISNNANKGILNKHEGTADVTSAMVTFTSNRIAIANEDKAVFEFSKAKILMSTQTNIYCYDGTVNLHDAVLNASTSNNVRIIDGTITMKNVEVNGNSQKSNTSHHGIYMEGGSINAENVTVSMTTGHGIRNKGGVFKGKNIVMHDINRVAVSQGKHDYLDVEGLTEINGLEVQSTNYSNVWNEGGGTVKITNAKLAVASSNSVRVNDGLVELTNVTIPGHKEGLKNNIHGIYMAGGKLVGKKISIANTTGSAVRSVKGMASLMDLKINNIGVSAFNIGNDGNVEAANVTITKTNSAAMLINGNGNLKVAHLTTSQINGQNILVEKNGKADISNAVLCKVEKAHNVKTAGNGLVKMDAVKVLGTAAEDKYGIITEKGGDAILNNVEVSDVQKHAAIRINHADSRIDGSDVTISNCQNGLTGSDGKVVIDGMKISDIQVMAVYSEGANITVSDLKTENITEGNVRADRKENARVVIKGAELCQTKTGHNVKVGMGLITLKDVEIKGLDSNAPGDKRAIIAEGGSFNLTNVQIHDVPKSGAIHVNKAASKVTGKDVIITDCANGITGSNGKVNLDRVQIQNIKTMAVSSTGADVTLKHFTTEGVKEGNVRADVGEGAKVTITDAVLCQTETGHNVKAGMGLITLKDVEIKGLDSNAPGDKRAIIAEGGNVNLTDVQIHDVPKSAAIHVNKEVSKVTGKNITITDCANGITGSNGKVNLDRVQIQTVKTMAVSSTGADVTLKHLTTEGVKEGNVRADVGESAKVTIEDATLCKTETGHNVKAGKGLITLKNVEIKGLDSKASGDKRAIIAEGGNCELNDVTITDASKTNAIHVNRESSKVTGKNVTITDCNNGISCSNGIVIIDNLVTENIANNTVLTTSKGNVTVMNSEVSVSAGHNMKAEGGLITLDNVKVLGVKDSSKHVLMAEGGDFELTKVELAGAKNAAIRINRAASNVTGKAVIIAGSANGITGTAGEVRIDGLTTSGITTNNLLAESTCKIHITKGDFCSTTGSHNVKATGTAVITLNDTSVKGTGSDSHHAVMAEGGSFVLNDVEISGVNKNAAGAGIRINRVSSTVTGKNITITDCAIGISNSNGSVEMENIDTTGVTADGIWTNKTVKIAGVVKAKIHMDEAVSVTATKALTGSAITLDWAEDKLPADLVGIQFANAEDAEMSKGTVVFGEISGEKYAPYFLHSQMLLTDKSNMMRTVTNYAELLETLEYMKENDITNAMITIAGDIVVENEITIEAGKEVRLIDDGTVRTISRAANYTKGNLFYVEAGAKFTLASTSNNNKRITLKLDGGSANDTPIITGSDSSFIKNSGIVTVGSGVELANAKGSEEYCKALAIYADTNSVTEFKGVLKSIKGQYADGRGIAVTITKVRDFVIEDARIEDNYTPGEGIIRLEAGGRLTIRNSVFKNNESVKEGGVLSDSGNAENKLLIENSEFTENRTAGNGGVMAIHCQTKDNITITGTTFKENKAAQGAAINLYTGACVSLTDCEFKDNRTTAQNEAETICGYGDIRLGDNSRNGGIYISGKMIVDIYMNQAGVVNVVDELSDGSDVVANWRIGKITGENFAGIRYASAEVMSASKEYVSLSDNYSSTYVIQNIGTTGTLAKPTVVTSEAELKAAIAAIGQTADKTGFVKVTKDFTISATVTIPTGVNVTILDDGTARTLKRATKNIIIFDVKSGAAFNLAATSGDNKKATLIIDGASASITNSNGASLINASGNVYVGKGTLLTNNKSTGNNQGFGIYSQTGSETTFCGTISNIVGTHASVKGNVFVIKGAFTLKDALVKENQAVALAPIRVQGGQLTAINTTFQGNTSTNGNAGALYVDATEGNMLTIDGCTFKENTAARSGGAISIEGYKDTNTIKNTKFIDNTASAGGAINMLGKTYLNLESCEFSGNKTTNTATAESKCGYGDVRLGDNAAGGAIRISGKMVVDIYLNQAGKIQVVGELTEGSRVVANWRIGKITGNSWTGINFANADIMAAGKDYFELSANYKDTYELTFSGTSGILKKK